MAYFHKNILARHTALERLCEGRSLVIMEEILRDARSLRLPVTPDTHGTVMDMVSPHDDIDGSMQLDPRYLSSAELHHIVDMMNVVVLDDTEDTAHSSDDTALFTVMDIVAPYYMASDLLLKPSVILSAAYGIPADEEKLRHEFNLADRRTNMSILLRIAKSMKLKAVSLKFQPN